jgi:hypothetical protein
MSCSSYSSKSTVVIHPGRRSQEIWMAETKKDAVKAFDAFVETYQSWEVSRSSQITFRRD